MGQEEGKEQTEEAEEEENRPENGFHEYHGGSHGAGGLHERSHLFSLYRCLWVRTINSGEVATDLLNLSIKRQ